MIKKRDLVVASFIIAAALTRVLPHPWNFSPVGAMALFGGARFRNRWNAFLFPLVALILSDAILGFYPDVWVSYGAFCGIVWLGTLIQNSKNPLWIALAMLGGSVGFFIITNFGVWALQSIYPKTGAGLQACYVAALPFFQNTLEGDLVYTGILFGSYALAAHQFPVLQDRSVSA